jgi:Cd2+/Zn2+-exporting ATPase
LVWLAAAERATDRSINFWNDSAFFYKFRALKAPAPGNRPHLAAAMSATPTACSLAVVQLGDHAHSPGCGHDLVAHDGHFDYLGDDGELHHLLDSPDCCSDHTGRAVTVSHGRLHHRKTAPSPERAACLGPDCTRHCCAAAAAAAPPSPAAAAKALARKGSDEAPPAPPPPGGGGGAATPAGDALITRLYCDGICCPMEVPVIQGALRRLTGVLSVEVAVVTKTVTVHHFPSLASPAAMVAALNEARLGASLTFPRRQAAGRRSWAPPAHVLAAAALLLVSLLHYLSGPTGAAWLEQLKWAALGSVAIALPGIALKALGALRHWVLDIHMLIAIAAGARAGCCCCCFFLWGGGGGLLLRGGRGGGS